jgi:RNA polymerase sigma-70 factor (ECF subfamily)
MTAPGDASDETLAERASLGSLDAFDTLALRYHARIHRLAWRLVGPDDAPDVVQDAFLSAFRHIGTFRGEARFSTWLYRIATNAGLMHRRSRARRRTEPIDDYLPSFDGDGTHHGTPAALQVASRADEVLDRRLIAERALAVLDQLPDGHRSAFVLRDLEELPTSEVSEILGIEPAAVRQRVHRARLLLRGLLSALMEGQS